MFKKTIFYSLLVLALSGCQVEPQDPICAFKTQQFIIGDKVINGDIACTREDKRQGLMNKKSIPENYGMLFVFPESNYHEFWMKNTYVPLSIAFIDENWKIVDIKDMKPHDETPVGPSAAAKYALEVNQGWFKKNNIALGTQIKTLKP